MTHTIKVHPGRVLIDELEERGLSQTQLATHLGVLPKTINEICRGNEALARKWLSSFHAPWALRQPSG